MDNVLPLPIRLAPEPPPAVRGAPKIVHETPLVTVYHGRAEDTLPLLRTESVDLVVTDPPYGVEWQSNRRTEKFDPIANDGGADRDLIRTILTDCIRVVGQHRHLYVFGPSDVLEGQKVSDVVTLIWDKATMGSGDVTSCWGPQHEPINFTVSKHRHAGKAGKPVLPTRMRKGSVLRYTRPTGRTVRHPSEKPVPLMRELVESSSRQGETVLDCFAGSGATGVAAILAGRKAVLIESDANWIDLIVSRCTEAEQLAAKLAAI